MKSTWLIFSLVLFLIFPIDVFCQPEYTISKPRLELSNEYLVIEYDIHSAEPSNRFNVWIEVTNASGFIINARSLSGDVGEDITGGLNKRILWNLAQDSILIDEEIFVEVRAELQKSQEEIPETETKKEPTMEIVDDTRVEEKTIAKGNMVISSLVLPGLGQSKIKKGKPYWLMGVAGYGCIAGSIYLNRQAIATYDDYKLSSDVNESNSLYDKAVTQNQYSKILAYSAIGIWTIDLIWVLAIPNSSLRSPLSQNDRKMKIRPYYDTQWKSTMLSFNYRF